MEGKIVRDENPSNPRKEYDHLGTMIYWHRKYDLGDKHKYRTPEEYREDNTDVYELPLFLYDHGGITISTTPFSDPWDSGQIGYIYVSKKAAREEGLSEEQVYKLLEAEVAEYDAYLTGDVWGYVIEDDDGEELESVWGYYGSWYAEAALEAALADFRPVCTKEA